MALPKPPPLPKTGPTVRRIQTEDGSCTLQRVHSGWTYRSVRGAATEAEHIFVEASGVLTAAPPVRVLEFGFGAGGNFAATLRRLQPNAERRLEYHALECDPVASEELVLEGRAAQLARDAVDSGVARDAHVSLHIHMVSFVDCAIPTKFDAIYFDPFGPGEQPDSWTTAVFERVRDQLTDSGRMVTYSAAGWVRRNMAQAGLWVATAAGPPGKREFTIASRGANTLKGLRLRNTPAGET